MGQDQSKLYTLEDLAEFYAAVQRGDILQFPRGIYSHFGVYVGWYKGVRHMVVHLTTPADVESGVLGWFRKKLCSNQSFENTLEKVQLLYKNATGKEIGNIFLDTVETVMGPGGTVRIRNDYDEEYSVDGQDNICNRALQSYHEREENPEQYSLSGNNCEHFANRTRYQQPKSKQVETVATVGAAAVGGLAVIGAASLVYSMVKDSKKKREREHEDY